MIRDLSTYPHNGQTFYWGTTGWRWQWYRNARWSIHAWQLWGPTRRWR